MNCRVTADFDYPGTLIHVGSVIDIPDSEMLQYKQFLDCSASGAGKDPKPEDATP